MKLDRKDFLGALKQVDSARSSQDFIPILTHFCFDGKNLTAFNDKIAIQTKFATEFKGGLPGTVSKLVGSYSTESIELNPIQGKDSELEFKSGKNKLKLPLLPTSQFLYTPPNLENSHQIKITPQFKGAVESCMVSVGTDPTHPEQLGCFLEYGKKVTVYSTDNQSISRATTDCTCEDEGNVLLPTEFCQELISLMGSFKGSEFSLYIGEGFVVVEGGGVHISSKVLDRAGTRILDFDRIVDSIMKKLDAPQPIPDDMLPITERSLILLERSIDKCCTVDIKGNSIQFTTETPDGESRDWSELATEVGKDMVFKVDPRLLKRALEKCTEISFHIRTVVMQDANFLHLLSHFESVETKKAKK